MICNSVYGNTSLYNYKFCDLFCKESEFEAEYKASGLYDSNNKISDTSISLLYYLLYATHGNDSITSNDPNRWKYRLFSIIFAHGPTWEKRMSIQKSLRELTKTDLQNGSTLILNHAFNPETAPTTQTTTELDYINEQNVTKNKRSLLDAYNTLALLLEDDITDEFLDRFKPLFKFVVEREAPLFYSDDDIDNQEEELY